MLGEPVYFEDHQAVMSVVKPDSPQDLTRTVRDQIGQSYEYWQWGDDNQLPTRMVESVEKNVLLPEVINFKKKALTSGGIIYGREEIVNNERTITPLIIPEIDEGLERTNIEAYTDEATEDRFTFGNVYPEFLLNMRREIVGIQAVDASECRLEKQATEGRAKGRIQNVYVSANWDQSRQLDLQIVPALDPLYELPRQIQEGRKYKYIIPIRPQTRGSKYYSRAPIQSLMDSGWLDVANSIPKWKQAVMDNQLSIKYHIQVNIEYLISRFPNWAEVDANARKNYQKQVVKELTDVMEGKENAGKAVMSIFENKNGVEQVGWKIDPINDAKFGEKTYIEDASASDSHIAYSQGIDPTLMGVASRNGMSAGSGSDKRMALNQLILMMRPDQRNILSPLQVMATVNDWHKKYGKGSRIAFQFKNFHVATLDQVSEKNRNIVP
jgi:hypothetical protein